MFAKVPDQEAQQIKEVSKMLTYGWGVIPCTVTIGKTSATTSLFPKDGGYLVPIKVALSKPESVNYGQQIKITLTFNT
jgi:hypothetical protein